MDDFRAASTIVPQGDGRFTWDVPDGWQQGKGAFGGLVIGALARALGACEPEPERALRSISAELCGPMLTGATAIAVTVLRRGRGVTYLEAPDGPTLVHQTDDGPRYLVLGPAI